MFDARPQRLNPGSRFDWYNCREERRHARQESPDANAFRTAITLANLPAVGVHGVKGRWALEDLGKLDSDLYKNPQSMQNVLAEIHRSSEEFRDSGGRQKENPTPTPTPTPAAAAAPAAAQQQPNTPPPAPATHVFSKAAWLAAHPGGDVNAANTAAATQQKYKVVDKMDPAQIDLSGGLVPASGAAAAPPPPPNDLSGGIPAHPHTPHPPPRPMALSASILPTQTPP